MKIYLTRKLPDIFFEELRDFDISYWPEYAPPTKEQIISCAKDCEVLVTLLSDRIDKEVIDALTNLKLISQYAVGYDNIDVDYATQKGIYVTNTPGVLTDATADMAWALLMAAARRIVEADSYVRSGSWYKSKTAWHPEMLRGYSVWGKIIGIIGFGRIGQAVARRAKGFGMKILYWSKTKKPDAEAEIGAEYVPLDRLLQESDFISLHVPLTPETENLIDKEAFKKMKSNAILINTARGKVVDLDALYDALKNKLIAAAGLDVFPVEPMPADHPIFSLKNVVFAPHIGSATYETRDNMAVVVAENIKAFYEGKTPPCLVNKEVLRG